jgi:hypothetical protein
MKNLFSKYIILSASAAFLLLSFNSYVKKIKFLRSSVVPKALGYVTIKKDKKENYVIKIKVEELAEVKKLEPSKKQIYSLDGNRRING